MKIIPEQRSEDLWWAKTLCGTAVRLGSKVSRMADSSLHPKGDKRWVMLEADSIFAIPPIVATNTRRKGDNPAKAYL